VIAIANDLPDVLETTEAERLATGFIFAEGLLWHPDGYWYFVDLRRNQLLRLIPGKEPELVRTTIGGSTRHILLRAIHARLEGSTQVAVKCSVLTFRAVLDRRPWNRSFGSNCGRTAPAGLREPIFEKLEERPFEDHRRGGSGPLSSV
jgi:hypothetical protein